MNNDVIDIFLRLYPKRRKYDSNTPTQIPQSNCSPITLEPSSSRPGAVAWGAKFFRFFRLAFFTFVYIINPILPLFLLWRAGWIRYSVRNVLHPITPETAFYPPLQNMTYLMELARIRNNTELFKTKFWTEYRSVPDNSKDMQYLISTLFEQEAHLWDNDTWSFGQVLSLSLWFSAFLELLYMLIGSFWLSPYCVSRQYPILSTNFNKQKWVPQVVSQPD